MKIYLVDYENLQQIPNLEALDAKDKILIFIGVHQNSLKIEVVETLLKHRKVEIIHIGEQGKNNLDFHICYYLGMLDKQSKAKVQFEIISNDKGFDSLIAVINKSGRTCKRIGRKEIEDDKLVLPINDEHQALIQKIKSISVKNRPQKVKTLLNALSSFSKIKYDEKIIPILAHAGLLNVDKEKIIWH